MLIWILLFINTTINDIIYNKRGGAMTVKSFLKNVSLIAKQIAVKNKMLEKFIIEQAPSDCHAATISDTGIKVFSHLSSDSVCNFIISTQRQIEELKAKQTEIICMINSLKEVNYSILLCYRYVLNWDWIKIADFFHYSLSHVFFLHKKALKLFYESYKDKVPELIYDSNK